MSSKAAVCCSTPSAWGWVEALTDEALAGDEDLRRLLPNALQHYLAAAQRERFS